MKDKHIRIRINQCLALAEASNCPRRKLAAMLMDPVRNVILADGYNGGPRGAAGKLCKGDWCERDGIKPEDIEICGDVEDGYLKVFGKNYVHPDGRPDAKALRIQLLKEYPPIKSGTTMERGCHHAEMNVICNAAAKGVACEGAWMIVLAEPCVMCAKIVHHAGITKLIVVDGGYAGGKAGVFYLREHGIEVQEVEGPRDPRWEGVDEKG